jgi:succinoglycan biosynthesis transport protein ExoP
MSELSIGCPEATASRINRARASESAFCARAADTWVFRSVSCWFDSVTEPLPKNRCSEGERLARSLENEAKVAGARLETLSATLEQAKRQSASTSDQDVQLRALEREAKAQRDLFESYLAKYREATARDSIAAAPADARVISRAVVSNIPFYPKKVPIVLIATVGTFSLAMAFVVTGALLSGDSGRPAPLQIDTTPVQAQVPTQARTQTLAQAQPEAAPQAPAAARPAAPKSAAPKTWRSRLPAAANVPPPPKPAPAPGTTIEQIAASLQQSGDAGRCIVVIGAARDVGTTLSAIALSRELAQTSRVILIDLAFAGPNIEVISSDPSAPGIAELVRGEASFGDIITRDRATRLHLVAAGQLGNDAEGIFVSQMLWAAIGALAQSYDHLVIDAGAQSETSLEPIAQVAPSAVLVGGVATAAGALNALSEELAAAGFAKVSVLTGPPPALEPASVQSAA